MVVVKIGQQITITCGDLDDIYDIRKQLIKDYDISFDTGCGKKGYDFFLDWSLEHSKDISRDEAIAHIKKRLDEAGLKYTVRMETYEDVD